MKFTQPLLVIRLAVNSSQDEYWWLPEGAAASSLTAEQAASFSKTTPALVLLDAAAIRLDEVTLPPGVKVTEAALLLEEQVCQPIEDLLVIELEKQGRQVKLATLANQLAEDWQERLADKNIHVARWVPEALCLAELWQEPEPLLLVDDRQAKLWKAEDQTLLSLPLNLLNTKDSSPLIAANTQQMNINDLPHQALVPWLAAGIPAKLNLWPESLFSFWLNKLPIKQLKNSLQLTPKQWLLATPWLLLLVVLLVQQGVQGLAKPSNDLASNTSALNISALNATEVRQQVEILDRRLDNYTQHLHFQEERLTAWQNLLSQLKTKQHIQVAAMQLTSQGITAELVGVQPTDQSSLLTLDGRWRFNDEQAVWELKL